MAKIEDGYHPESHAETQERFNHAMEALENKYRSFFDDRKSFLYPEEPDKLIHHIKISHAASGKRLLFHKKSDLPKVIRDDVDLHFHMIWSD